MTHREEMQGEPIKWTRFDYEHGECWAWFNRTRAWWFKP